MMQVLFIKPLLEASTVRNESLLLKNENDMTSIHVHGFYFHYQFIILFLSM